jgi:NAD(P)-dependent dehydrogenase (short-subunit alcohol dehydrogenase family)
MRRILIIGATGVFGRRLAQHLARLEDIELMVSSRSLARSEELARALRIMSSSKALVTPIALDHKQGLAETLARIAPFAVIDCSGPFQTMGYEVPRAVLEAGAHFIDLADARGYILGFEEALDGLAWRKGVAALAGASSSPTVAAAAVDALTQGWQRIDSIDIAITPAGRTEVGEAATAAVLSYAGKPVPQWREGKLQSTSGWASSHRMLIPGLGHRRVAPVETVDAELLTLRHKVTSRVAFYAGLESPFEHWGMVVLANLRKRGWIRNLMVLLPLLMRARYLTRIPTGTTGAMVVKVTGLNAESRFAESTWTLLARDGDGPHVPTLPAAVAVKALLAGQLKPGARPAAGLFDLAAIEAEFAPYKIAAERAQTVHPSDGFMQRAVGANPYVALPQAIRAFHDTDAPPVWTGMASVEEGRGVVTRLIAHVVGLPKGGRELPITVTVDRQQQGTRLSETWTRNFDGLHFHSTLSAAETGKATERFGPLTFDLGLAARDGEIAFPVTGWRIGPLRLPRFLCPRSEAREFVDGEGRFNFDVRMSLPFFGLLAHYRGWLKPVWRE